MRNAHAVAAITMAMLAGHSAAQGFPTKPIRVFLPFAAGAGGDVATRVVTTPLGEALGQPVIIDNKAGAGGAIAAEQAARSTPDGYTLLVGTASSQVYRPFLVRNVTYDVNRDFTPIGIIGNTAGAILVSPSLPIRSVKELIDYARANPDKLSYATSGVGSNHHLSMAQIQTIASVKLQHVPYKAVNQAMLDIIAGQIPVAFTIIGPAVPHIRAGKLRALALDSEHRSSRAPEVPTIRETLAAFESPPAWMALFGPAGLPQPVTRRLNGELVKVVSLPAVKSKLEDAGFEVEPIGADEFAAVVKRNIALAEKMIKAAGIEPE
jgi:tripartite-type tricarboxylate transporter receptor subunit TctC